jgi:hypothetical protein
LVGVLSLGLEIAEQVGVAIEQREEFHEREWGLGLAVLVA